MIIDFKAAECEMPYFVGLPCMYIALHRIFQMTVIRLKCNFSQYHHVVLILSCCLSMAITVNISIFFLTDYTPSDLKLKVLVVEW